jgi:hypothetical protein
MNKTNTEHYLADERRGRRGEARAEPPSGLPPAPANHLQGTVEKFNMERNILLKTSVADPDLRIPTSDEQIRILQRL